MSEPLTYVAEASRASLRRGSQVSSKRVPRRLRAAQALWLDSELAQRFPQPKRGRLAQGLRYERKVNSFLTATFGGFISNLPFEYYDSSGRHLCIPDGLLVGKGEAVIFEVKLSHTIRAYWELTTLYRPVVARALGLPVRVAEVTANYDPSAPFPTSFSPFRTFGDFLNSPAREGVILWRPQR